MTNGLDTPLVGGQAAFPADCGGEPKRPGTARLANGAGGGVQQGASLRALGSIEHQPGALGAAGLGLETGQPLGVEGPNGMAYALCGTAELLGDLGRALPAPTGQQDVAASQGKGVRGTEPGCQLLALLGRSRANIERWFHTP